MMSETTFQHCFVLQKAKYMERKQTARIIVHPSTAELFRSTQNKAIFVKPYTSKELRVLYGVSEKTFRKWLKPFAEEIGRRNGAYFSVRQVRVIFDKLDVPHYYEVA